MDSAVSNNSVSRKPGFAETFAGILIEPGNTLRRLSHQDDGSASGLAGAAICVFLVFSLDALRITPARQMEWALVNIPAGIFVGVGWWLLLASTLALLAACFNVPRHRLGAIYVTIGWSFAPWILMAPVWCFRALAGHAFFLLSVIPFVWTIATQIYAIKVTFELKSWQTLALVFVVPLLFWAFSGLQTLQALYVTFSSLVR